ncbi:MAG: FKBP-type peptidyl-prolyl cis-trans isomerase [Gammaproteobacteria bacterium]|nr:FKBP-type peptidyl-prolyl cis-trans isomerase [Gammaproteobacteria bacterium]
MRTELGKLAGIFIIAAALLTACEKQPKITTTDDGLVIEELVAGTGAEAQMNSSVTVHYTGWLYDDSAEESKGEKFDSSLDRDAKFSFVLGQGRVIKGWEQGVTGMQVGGQRRLTIPPDLAYGSRGAGKVIPPDATLVFDIELFDVDTLEIIDQVVGDGPEAVKGAKVAVDYTGWLYDESAAEQKGTRFDSSLDRGNKFRFVLGAGQVIPGWDLGVAGMKVGGKRTLIIPAALAYGKRGSGKSIPPDSRLLFDVELFEVDTAALK